MQKRIVLLLIAFISLFSLGISFTYADCGGSSSGTYNYTALNSSCPPTLTQISGVAVSIIEIILVLSGIVFFIMIVINGFTFMTAMGEPDKIESARKGLLFTVVGFGLIFGSFLLVSFVGNITGISKGNGFVVNSDGSIQFNILSTFTPTPLPGGAHK